MIDAKTLREMAGDYEAHGRSLGGNWQYKNNSTMLWVDIDLFHWLNFDTEYRRKPRTITVNGIEVPEPLRVAPEMDTYLYIANPASSNFRVCVRWVASNGQINWLERGMLHNTEEAAEAHARAMVAASRGDGE